MQVLIWDLRDHNGGSWLSATEDDGRKTTESPTLPAKLRLQVVCCVNFKCLMAKGLLVHDFAPMLCGRASAPGRIYRRTPAFTVLSLSCSFQKPTSTLFQTGSGIIGLHRQSCRQ